MFSFEDPLKQNREAETQEAREFSPSAKMEQLIDELRQTSKFEREVVDGQETIRSPEGEEYLINRVQSSEDPRILKVHELLAKNLGEDEVDSLEIIRGAVSDPNCAYHVVENQGREPVALANSVYLELPPAKNTIQELKSMLNPVVDLYENGPRKESLKKEVQDAFRGIAAPAESIAFVAYIVTDPDFRKQGVGSELYQNIFQHALERSQAEGTDLKGIIGEAGDKVESFLNRMDRKRIYYEDKKGDVREVPYVQAPIEWNEKTGKPKSKSVPEHLMLRMLDDRQNLSKEELLAMVKAIYGYNYIPEEDFFQSEEAFQGCRDTVSGIEEKLAKALERSKDGQVFLMSAQERAERLKVLTESGKKLHENKRRPTKESVVE